MEQDEWVCSQNIELLLRKLCVTQDEGEGAILRGILEREKARLAQIKMATKESLTKLT